MNKKKQYKEALEYIVELVDNRAVSSDEQLAAIARKALKKQSITERAFGLVENMTKSREDKELMKGEER